MRILSLIAIMCFFGISTANAAAVSTNGTTSVDMYTMTTCPICKIMAIKMKQSGIPFTEYSFDKDNERKLELEKRLNSAGVDATQVTTAPILFIGTHVYWGMTPMSTVQAAMRN